MQADDGDELNEGRILKRQKLSNGDSRSRRSDGASRFFAPYRTVGLVSPTAVPFTAIPLGKTTFQITTSVGNALQTYDLRRGLNLVFITRPQTLEIITASAAWKNKVIAAWGGDDAASPRGVWVFERGKKKAELELPKGLKANIKCFCIFGSWIVGVSEAQLLVWNSTTYELHTVAHGISPVPFSSCIASLPTYLNKVIIGRQDGSAEIWNVSSGKLIYTILPPSITHGAVTAIEPTPALSLVAIAYESGPLIIHDTRTDQTVIQLSNPSGVPVTSISFRSDGMGAGDDGRVPGVMATASTHTGDVTLWDLNDGGRRAGVLRAAHAHPHGSVPGGVNKVQFLSGQAVLVTGGLDNSLTTWIFDDASFSPVPRILHSRSGHGAAVTNLQFLPAASDGSDDTGKWLMSAGLDRSLWGWSLRRDGQSTELSQGAIQQKAKKQGLLASGNRDMLDELKCPPIISIACSLNRDGGIGALPGKHPIWKEAKGKQVSAEISGMTGWESVVTAHKNDKKARTWFWGRKRAGRWAFQTGDDGNVSSVAISQCGTFAVVGSERGGIDIFNLQSGIHRQRFPARLTPTQAKQLRLDLYKHGLTEEMHGKDKFYRGQGKHGCAVIGLAIDSLNSTVISAGADGKIKFWDFKTGLLQHEIDWSVSCGLKSMRDHRGSDLAAFSCTDGCVRVVDVSTQRLIRELWPSRPALPELDGSIVTDLSFSFDGHWIAACVGHVILLWDLPTGHLVDAFKLRAPCTSLAFSPTGEFLATATVDSVGVDIWTNRALFTQVAKRHIGSEELARILMSDAQAPSVSGEGGEALVPMSNSDNEEVDHDLELPNGMSMLDDVDQVSSELLSLSLVPRSRWQNLLHLDLIRQRNKPVEPPKKPEKAPFFLPSLQDRQPSEAQTKALTNGAAASDNEPNQVSRFVQGYDRGAFTVILQDASSTRDFGPVVEHLRGLNPPAADIEIRSMSVEGNDMIAFVESLIVLLQSRRDFELVQAWMAVFLKIHSDAVAFNDDLREAVERWSAALRQERRRLQRLTDYCSGLAGYLRAARV